MNSSTTGSAVFLLILSACGGADSGRPPAVVVPAQPPSSSQSAVPLPAPVAGAAAAPRVVLTQIGGSCGLDADGHVWSFQSGSLVAEVPSFTARTVTCGPTHSCAVTTDGALWCWGQNSYGALGDGTERPHTDAPVRVSGIANVADVGVFFGRTCARTATGDVYCWGDSEFGIAGDGRLPDNVGREKLLPGKAILSQATTLAVGMTHACSILANGRVSCWGQNHEESCGQPASTRYVPRPLVAPSLKDIVHIAAGESVTCTIDKAGKVGCFGRTNLDSYKNTPVSITLPGPAVEIVVGTKPNACARLADGTVHCWGRNEDGELGDGTTTDRLTTAAPAKGVTGATAIAAYLDRVCALVAGGRLLCWGNDLTPTPAEITVKR